SFGCLRFLGLLRFLGFLRSLGFARFLPAAATAGGLSLLLTRLLLIVRAAIFRDVEARALEENPRARGRHAHRAPLAARATLRRLVLDAVEQLESMAALAALVFVGRHRAPFAPYLTWRGAKPARNGWPQGAAPG